MFTIEVQIRNQHDRINIWKNKNKWKKYVKKEKVVLAANSMKVYTYAQKNITSVFSASRNPPRQNFIDVSPTGTLGHELPNCPLGKFVKLSIPNPNPNPNPNRNP